MVAPITEALRTESHERVRNTLNAIFETLVEEFGMEPDEVGSLLLDVGSAVAGIEGDVYLDVVMRKIEQRLGRSLIQDRHSPPSITPRRHSPRKPD